jgi:peptidoglycan/LPS O-acetylase OafA/YrhL
MRNSEIDGLRGWASLVVILFHFYQEIFGNILPQLHSPLFGFVFSGPFAVLVFFVLSGDALSTAFFDKEDYGSLARLVVTRYFRLTFIILLTCLLVYILMVFGLVFNMQAARIVGREDWLGGFLGFEPSFYSVLKYSLYDVYFSHQREASYNPFLWTMSIELMGSMVVFINLFVIKHIKRPILFFVGQLFFFLVFGSYVAAFLVGMIFSYLRSQGGLKAWADSRRMAVCAFLVAMLVIAVVSCLSSMQGSFHGVTWARLVYSSRFGLIWAALLVLSVYMNPWLRGFFSSRFSDFLGKISFPLYAVQFAVLISVYSWGVTKLEGNLGWMVCLSMATGAVIVAVVVAWLLYLVERRYLIALKVVSLNIMRK